MVRKILLTVLFLGFLGILYWQWPIFDSKNRDVQGISTPVIQEITVKTKLDSLQVTQIFYHLNPNGEYRISVPEMINEWSCVKKNGAPCVQKDSKSKSFQPESTGTLKFQFSIKIPHGLSAIHKSNWLMKLENVPVHKTKLEMVDSVFRKGTWVAALALKGFNKQKYIDYYVFEGVGDNPDLYWQDKPLNIISENSQFTIYSENKTKSKFLKLQLPSNAVYTAFIHSSAYLPESTQNMYITNNPLSVETVRKISLTNYFFHKFQKSRKDDWLVDVFLSLYLHIPANTAKGKFVIDELNNHLKSSEIEDLVKLVFEQKFANPNDLDHLLKKISGFKTNFFAMNDGQGTYSLVLFDNRKVRVNGDIKHLQVLRDKDVLLFPLMKTMKSLGYNVTDNHDQSILIKNKQNQFIIFEDQSRFLHNGQNFGVLENPFRNKNGIIYINGKGLYTLFKVKVILLEKEISLSD
ncbi:MAG TPA: hypothetical protein VJ546_00335 [Bacillales bacterium]|nr:hypothetical protein [Bacillales bacterium]